jgi:aspartokinase/homoserine dehydrogenase 1
MSFNILKFGGTSVASSQNIKKIEQIIFQEYTKNQDLAVVVSAFGNLANEPKVTDLLIQTGELAADGNKKYLENLEIFENKHINTCIQLELKKTEIEEVKQIFTELRRVLEGIFLMQEMTVRSLDFVVSFGERLSAFIISKYLAGQICKPEYQKEIIKKYNLTKKDLPEFKFLDAREVILTDSNFNNARVDFSITEAKIKSLFRQPSDSKIVYIITGFISANDKKQTTTLGRGGSDYTAAIFGAALEAEQIQIWTDVDGVLTSDPKKVKKAFSLENLSYDEAMEVSHFGAKVIYPPTIEPARKKNIPLVIKNTFNPSHNGTVISDHYKPSQEYPYLIKGVTSLSDLNLIRIQGVAFKNKYDISARLFNTLAKEKIDIILVSKSSSQFSMCLAIKKEDTQKSVKIITQEFQNEIEYGTIDPIKVQDDVVVIAVVGENMRQRPGVSGMVFSALGKNGINVIAIAQGSNEINISTVIDKKNQTKALQAIHDEFFSKEKNKTLNIFIAGATGLIGSELIKQILEHKKDLSDKNNLDLNIVGLANSKYIWLDENLNQVLENSFVDKSSLKEIIQKNGQTKGFYDFKESLINLNLPNSVFVDCTNSGEIATNYDSFLEKSIAVVTPNKKAASASYEYFKRLRFLSKTKNTHYHFETNVGAGLPVISVVRDLVYSGDEIIKIEGVLSGTLSYLFNTLNSKTKFTEVLKQAQQKGFTEPDPRDDLSGMDVARKILILARTARQEVEMHDVKLDTVVDKKFFKENDLQEFYKDLENTFDDLLKTKLEKLEKENKKLRYLASMTKNAKGTFDLEVKLREVDKNHPSYNLTGSENIIAFWTKRYNTYPLVIKGPGAGAEVTAAGVFADIIKCKD